MKVGGNVIRHSLPVTDLVAGHTPASPVANVVTEPRHKNRLRNYWPTTPLTLPSGDALDQLVASVLSRHPRRDQALDHMLADMACLAEQEEQAQFDSHVDQDWDGWG